MCGTDGGRLLANTTTSPLRSAVSARAPPLYGMCSIWMRASLLSISIERWPIVPLPDEANVIALGFARATAITSFRLREGSDGCEMMMFGAAMTFVTGEKSLAGSYGSLL